MKKRNRKKLNMALKLSIYGSQKLVGLGGGSLCAPGSAPDPMISIPNTYIYKLYSTYPLEVCNVIQWAAHVDPQG